jgi:hypothetical protein
MARYKIRVCRIVSHRRASARFDLAVREVGVDGEVSASPQAGHTLGPLHGTRSSSVRVGGASPARLGYGGGGTEAGSRSAFGSLEFWAWGFGSPAVQLNKVLQGLASESLWRG